MKRLLFLLSMLFFICWSAVSLLLGEDLFKVQTSLWLPAEDEVYLQEVSQKIATDAPVTSVAYYDNQLYAVMLGEIFRRDGDSFSPLLNTPNAVQRLLNMDKMLWALTESGLYRLEKSIWSNILDQAVVDLCIFNDQLYAATREDLFVWRDDQFVNIKPPDGYRSSDVTVVMADGSQVLADPVRLGPIHRIVSYSGTLYILRPGQLVLLDGPVVNEYVMDWGELPSPVTHDMLALGSRLFLSTPKGLAVLRGAAMTTLKGADGLPSEETTCLAAGFAHDLWIGSTSGVIRLLDNDWHYFGPDLWLPGAHVHDIAVNDKTVAIATNSGVGFIHYEPYTLAKKAAYYERHLEACGHKRLGFIHTLYRSGETGEWIREISDNDGGHTAPYLAAMCYKYAVTGDKHAREEAVNAFNAMVWLDQITPKDGFIARAIWSTTGDKDKMARHGSGGLPAKWYPTEDGKWYWKGDTSSDEVDAHFYAVSLFHDLVAEGEEKELAKQHLTNIASHIIDNGWVLRDMNGQPTRWGRWDPDYLLRPYGYVARGLNGMQAQTYMLTAFAVSGDKKYQQGLQQVLEWGYHHYTVRQKITFPPEDIAPWDDNLAQRCYYTLFRYVEDSYLRSIYLRSLERTWALKRMEHIPWFNFSYGAITGNDCEVKEAVQHLREWPLDCIEYSYQNSHRDDLFPEPGYVPYGGGSKAMSPRETAVKRGSRNALPYDGGSGGRRVIEPTGFLRDYWMGRYHGFIKAPTVTDSELISVPELTGTCGAEPYNGPARPEIRLVKQ
ncbi:hypothetical protein JXA70_05410 [candidate division KSB1 bacterium]|nr:hypothetical protein [candidate division KSB1 bacterium]